MKVNANLVQFSGSSCGAGSYGARSCGDRKRQYGFMLVWSVLVGIALFGCGGMSPSGYTGVDEAGTDEAGIEDQIAAEQGVQTETNEAVDQLANVDANADDSVDDVESALLKAAAVEEMASDTEKTEDTEKMVATGDDTIDPNSSEEATLANLETEELSSEEPTAMPDAAMSDAAMPGTVEQGRLVSLGLEKATGASNRLVAELVTPGKFSFQKTAPSEYILTLRNTSMNPEVEKTLLAPKGSGSIRSVRPVIDGADTILRIFAEPAAILTVDSRGSKLVIAEASAEQLGVAADMMAQADLEADKKPEGAAPPAAENPPASTEGEAATTSEAAKADPAAPGDEDIEAILGPSYVGRLISLDLQDTDIDNALRIIAEVSNLNIIASDDVTGKVTLRLIDVPWDQALDVILKTNGLDQVREGNVIRIAPVEKLRAEREALRQAEIAKEELEPLKVQYIRVSYAKASSLQPLVETVLTERGTVAYDERTNQLIVKDIPKGLKNVARLVQKLDLRTPQVLIETQIIEAQHNFARDLGAELGFYYIRSPETGNATGYNFPNSIEIGGSAQDTSGETATSVAPGASFFPSQNPSSAVSFLFGSADATKFLNVRLSQAEQEGRVKIISRPSVAVTNNQPAVIKSVEKIRIKLPSGGVSVATGQGASAAGTSTVATEVVEIGIILNVTAQASPDYYVLLDIEAKSSTLGDINRGVDNIPPEIERSATSTVLVSSGQTFAMGGIYRIEESDTIRGVPYLKDIPFLGHLFRSISVTDGDEELIFFLTPRIIEGSFDDAAMKGVS